MTHPAPMGYSAPRRTSNVKMTPLCSFCNLEGHWTYDCPNKSSVAAQVEAHQLRYHANPAQKKRLRNQDVANAEVPPPDTRNPLARHESVEDDSVPRNLHRYSADEIHIIEEELRGGIRAQVRDEHPATSESPTASSRSSSQTSSEG